jgi:uncharacterized protein (TIGR00255 family)
MIKSMTGYCKTEVVCGEKSCRAEVRSVNHRYLEARISLPKQFQHFEETLKARLKRRITRGKVDINLAMTFQENEENGLVITRGLWDNVKALKNELQTDLGEPISLSMADLFNIKGLLLFEQIEVDNSDYKACYEKALDAALDGLIEMRSHEGKLLYKEISEHVNILKNLLIQIPDFLDEVVVNYRGRLEKNLRNLQLKYDANDPRLMQEIGIFIDRSDVTEEIERFRTHLTHLGDLLQKDVPVGRKIDFLLQELNREANTLCSKSCNAQMTAVGVEMKCEIEKIREQVQNIE